MADSHLNIMMLEELPFTGLHRKHEYRKFSKQGVKKKKKEAMEEYRKRTKNIGKTGSK